MPRLGGGKKWSLGPTTALLGQLGNPHNMVPTVHVAGTNGKGSTATLVAAALGQSGFRVGLYTSPHLVDLRERVQVDGQPISRDAFTNWTAILHDSIEETGASFFEAYTAIAFADIAARGADIAVIETGLGGRLDSTNVVSPLVSAVTSIGLEHTEYLGHSTREIAAEKAHVAKADAPFVVGETDSELLHVLTTVARERGARPCPVEAADSYEGELRLEGRFQRRNAAVARRIIQELPPSFRPSGGALRAGFARASVPGRFDIRGRWVFDIAHNAAAIEQLVETLRERSLPGPVNALVGILNDKDHSGMLKTLSGVVDTIVATVPPGAPGQRQTPLSALAPGMDELCREPDFGRALEVVQQGAETILVTGSAYTVGEAMARLPGLSPLG